MSVVNKMLQDLEARQSQTNEIKSDYHPPPKKQSKLLVLLLLILALSAIIFALTDINQLFAENQTNKVTASTDTQPLSPRVTKKMAVTPEKVLLETIQPQKTAEHLTKDTLVTTATEIEMASNLLADEQIQSQQPKTPITRLTKLANVDIQNKALEAQSNTEMSSQETAEQTSSFSMTGSSQENNANSLKQHIAESLSNDNLDLAQSLLYQLLETEPDNIKARKKLASLLFAQGNYAQSKQLLVQGMELHPTQSDLRLMLARLYVVQKEPSQALNILVEFQPSIDNQTEYLAYRAALAQQLKQTELAKSDYQVLANVEPTNAKWWLGLAIAEDQLGEIKMAVQAYSRASSLGQLDGSVGEFMQQRISVLAGTQ
ncbi:tetratricopeptide repeat protein [Paraglaciecola arctica]|uniref:MSHA biogenesis protein MshN n=1 Tax=Paraglaciecola arctica BSs20135 TaxID=493475 RepID=K6YK67_9ALTE|nr:tetratricopeptide repeat protein [Paraglaciecola arctica]GAC18582.1 MSHA biogenesis protein MshN [Paraglaciecola arctica BSs20135]